MGGGTSTPSDAPLDRRAQASLRPDRSAMRMSRQATGLQPTRRSGPATNSKPSLRKGLPPREALCLPSGDLQASQFLRRSDADRFELPYLDSNGVLTEHITAGGQDVIVHYDDVPESDITTVDGIRCTTALRTVIDLAPDGSPGGL